MIPQESVLIAFEESGTLRDEFLAVGVSAVSCDILPSRSARGEHIQGDVLPLLKMPWRGVYCFPPCTHLAVSGARHFAKKIKEGRQAAAIYTFMQCTEANTDHLFIEQPVGIMSTVYRSPDQYLQPWQYGHGETKKTCVWLKGLSKINPTNIVDGREARIHKMPPSENRARERSKTYIGIAKAIASQHARFYQ